MKSKPESYREILEGELQNRKLRNPRYSLRAFARDTGIDAGHLSRVLKRESTLSIRAALKIASALEMDSELTSEFARLVAIEEKNSSSMIKEKGFSVSVTGLEKSRAKEMRELIEKFENEFRARFVGLESRSSTYGLSIQLFEIRRDDELDAPAGE